MGSRYMASSDVLLDELHDKINDINLLSEKLLKLGVRVSFTQKPITIDGVTINTVESKHWRIDDVQMCNG